MINDKVSKQFQHSDFTNNGANLTLAAELCFTRFFLIAFLEEKQKWLPVDAPISASWGRKDRGVI